MPLEILAPLVVAGILGITILLHLTGNTAPRRLQNALDAQQSWLRQYPEIPAQNALLSSDQNAALIETEQGLGLVWTLGADTTARLLTAPVEIIDTHQGILLTLHDFAAPRVAINLSDPTTRATWSRHLSAPQKATA